MKKMNVPVAIAAKVYGKDPSWVRAGLIRGYLPIGFAERSGKRITDISEMDCKKGRITYYISPWDLNAETGFNYFEFLKEEE